MKFNNSKSETQQQFKLGSHEHICSITIKGYKSIKEATIDFSPMNVLIGPNGAGKSNLIGVFDLIRELFGGRLQTYVRQKGGAFALLHFGPKQTPAIEILISFGQNGYFCRLEPTDDNQLMFTYEQLLWKNNDDSPLGSGHIETRVHVRAGKTGIYPYVAKAVSKWRVYQFHDTSDHSPMKGMVELHNNQFLFRDGKNLAVFLYRLKQQYPKEYQHIRTTIQLVAPFFQDFELRPDGLSPDNIELLWYEVGSEVPFKAHMLSDGTLRFIAQATLLLMPPALQAKTIIIDEPELGLHPFATTVLTELLKSLVPKKQIILSTQSVDLLSDFEPEDVIVAERDKGASSFKRLEREQYETWLEDYSLGEMWEKNLLGGRP
jgi:predicted ATPase